MEREISQLVGAFEDGRLSRRALVRRLAAVAGVAGGAAVGLAAVRPRTSQEENGTGAEAGGQEAKTDEAGESTEATFSATDVNHIALRVTDLERSRDFYVKHLGMRVASQGRNSCFLRCGERDFLALFLAEEARMDHYCFSIREYAADDAVKRLEAAGIEARRRGNRVYFDDPDGIEVQVAAMTHGV